MTEEIGKEKTPHTAGPSETAVIAASLRALVAHDNREEIRYRDYLAEVFLPEDRKQPLVDQKARELVMKAIPPGMYEYVIARTAYFDSIVKNSLHENIPQIVFLGAGYDSRPYRFAEQIGNTKIFEMDAGPTQEQKILLLKQAGIVIPANIRFVPIDLNQDDLATVLEKAGYEKNQKTLFIWEGVTFYLSSWSIDNTLSSIVNIAPARSSICFDFHSYSPDGKSNLQTEIPAERIQFGIEQGKLKTFLADRGFQIIEECTATDMEEKFLSLLNGQKFGHIDPMMCFVHAMIGE